ncbi:hypothetical protein C2G38_2234594 [Gigaspora rosea]|uniref:Uncharacterized protein n=1 Tax=Gigaspora rosea TaxID=44941 RepID=A0A397TTW4_9GLOM|nr:hypothetical protein C2G38_2234594 [Gigaspora rosea]
MNKEIKNLQNLTLGEFLASEIEQVLQKVEANKFIGWASDSASSMKLAKNIIHSKYPFIMTLPCIAHQLHLISYDICHLPHMIPQN